MSATKRLSVQHPAAILTLLAVLCVCSTSVAQQYGQNPAARGFVPLANGPVPNGTTGDIGADTNGSAVRFGNNFGFGNNLALSFGPSSLTLTATDITDSGLLGFLGSFGNLDVTFQSMSGVIIHLQAVLNGTTLTVNADFNGGFGTNDDPDTDDPGDFDASPGNPSTS